MKRYVSVLAIVLIIVISCGTLAAQVPATKQPNPNVAPLGPQAHHPPGGQHPTPTGTIYGFVYWDAKATSHLDPSICNALAITVVTSSPYSPIGIVGTQSHFTSIPTANPPLTSVNTTSYDGCAYMYSNAPIGQKLYVKVNLTQTVGTLAPSVVAQYHPVGPIQFSSAPCTQLPPLTKATVGELIGNWGSCNDVAYDVNFSLVQTPQLKPLSAGGGVGGNQGSMREALVQVNSGPQNTPALTNLRPQQTSMLSQVGSHATLLNNRSSASSPSRGMLVPAVTPSPATTGPANSQPGTPSYAGAITAAGNSGLSGGLRTAANSSFTGGVKPALLPALTAGVRVVSGRRVRSSLSANSTIVAILRQQKQGSVPASQTLAAVPPPNRAVIPSNARLTSISAPYVPSNLLTPKQNAWCKQSEAQGSAPTIFSVTGKLQVQGTVYSPDPQANPYTIIGCGFGSSSGTLQLELLQSQPVNSGWSNSQNYQNVTVYTVNFAIQSWNDHEIVASLPPSTSGVPDWPSGGSLSINLQVKTRLAGYIPGGQFVALRQPVLLASIPQNQASIYQAGSPYFLSPASNYYGLNGTLAVMRQGLAGPVAGQDQFSLKLAPGFIVDSTQTDLLVANTSSNVTSQPATVNGSTITVTYPVLSAPAGNSSNYYSIYGLKVWVTGPQGLDPWTGNPVP
jgi:hypothetical protein